MLAAMQGDVSVVHEEAAFVVLDKPAGLLAVPGRGAAGADHLAGRAAARWADALVVHRLDMATSGLMLLARGATVQRALSMAFAARAVGKRYEAVVHGELRESAGEVNLPLSADWPARPRQRVDHERGRPCITRWRVLDRSPGRTRLELEPVTGRAHQLRVHLLAIGHPIVGDALYDPDRRAPRLLLHATQLAFTHPVHGQPCRFDSAAPF
jgi:tRNA pseudouridine32 synthase / 23S rRNA pseudouridine746 synthase